MIDAPGIDFSFAQHVRDEEAPELVLRLLRNIYLDLKSEAQTSAHATLGRLGRLAPELGDLGNPPPSGCDDTPLPVRLRRRSRQAATNVRRPGG